MINIRKFNDYEIPKRERIDSLDIKENLKQNFFGRCAYCNCHYKTLTGLEYQIEHIIPKKKAEDNGKPELRDDYNNMVYACKKCNLYKSQTWPFDDYDLNHTYDKDLGVGFYDPCLVDFNSIFYRDEYGIIMSDDRVGQYMIDKLKLYTLFRSVAWYCDKLKNLQRRLIEKKKGLGDKPEINSAIADIAVKLQSYLDYISACLN